MGTSVAIELDGELQSYSSKHCQDTESLRVKPRDVFHSIVGEDQETSNFLTTHYFPLGSRLFWVIWKLTDSSKLCQATGEFTVTHWGFCFVLFFGGINSPPISRHETFPLNLALVTRNLIVKGKREDPVGRYT